MGKLPVNGRLNDAVEALELGKRLGDTVIVMGASTGGTLATWLASHDQSNSIGAVILMSPNFGAKRKESELMLLPWGGAILQLVEGSDYQFQPASDLQQQYWITRYPS